MRTKKLCTAVMVMALAFTGCSGDTGKGIHPSARSYTKMPIKVVARSTTETYEGAAVTSGFFGANALRPVIGRYFVDSDFAKDATPTVVLSFAFFEKYFQRALNVVGTTFDLNGTRTTIIGVAPPDYDSVGAGQLWIAKRKE